MSHVEGRAFEVLPSYMPDEDLARLWLEAELAYQRGELEQSKRLLDGIIGDSQSPEATTAALVTRMAVHIASGEGGNAYSDLLQAIRRCDDGLKCQDNQAIRCMSMLSAMRIEALLLAKVFDFSHFDKEIEQLPLRGNPYFGYLLAARMMRQGKSGMAIGVSYVYLRLLGDRDAVPEIYHNIVMASSLMGVRNIGEAEAAFMHAWELGKSNQIYMSFIEHNYSLLGLPRHCLGIIESELGNEMRRRLRLYHKGWFDLRQRCGLTAAKTPLTPLELNAVLLASFGWRNKEIGSFLHIAENTVKHNLSNAYQKCQVLNRFEAQQIIERAIFDAEFR